MQQQLAHYQIEDLLGEGTFASVYRAFDQKFERDVALKILKPVWLRDPQAVERFKREAKTMAKLRHPHIKQSPTPSSTTPAPTCINSANLGGQSKIEDGGKFQPGESFEQVWSILNDGSCPWNEDPAWSP